MTSGGRWADSGTLLQKAVALAAECGRPDLAEDLRDAGVIRTDDVATVVVVGETNRGKSRFINALLSRRICPVAPHTSSNTFISISYGDVETARVVTEADTEPTAIDIEDVGSWASESGNPANTRGVKMVDVSIPSELLASGIRLVDTPGVGGLNAAHRKVTLASLSLADALIFVLDAEAPVSRPEAAFLSEAAERVATIFLVLAKSDLYFQWDDILREDKEFLSRRNAGFSACPFVVVSAADKEEADRTGDEELAKDSGFHQVVELVHDEVAGRAVNLRIWNLVRSITSALDQLELSMRQELRASSTDRRSALDTARAQAKAYSDQTQHSTGLIFPEFQRRVSNPVQLKFRLRLRALSEEYERGIFDRAVDVTGLAADLATELRALVSDTREEVVVATAELLGHLADVLDLGDVAEFAIGGADEPLPFSDFESLEARDRKAGRPRPHRATKAASTLRTALYGRSLTAALGPIGLVLGVAVGGLSLLGGEWSQRRERSVQEARGVLTRALEIARVEIDADLRARLVEAQQYVQPEVRFAVDQRKREFGRQVAYAEQLANSDDTVLDAEKKIREGRLRALKVLQEEAGQMGSQIEEIVRIAVRD